MKSSQKVIICILAAAIVICAAVFSVKFMFSDKTGLNDEPVPNSISSESPTEEPSESTPSESGSESVPDTGFETIAPDINPESGRIIVNIDENDPDWNLIVVNASREIPDGYVPKLQEVVNSGYEMDYRVAPYYEEMYYAAKDDGITLTPYSGYR